MSRRVPVAGRWQLVPCTSWLTKLSNNQASQESVTSTKADSMEQNKSVVDRVTSAFLEKMRESDGTSDIAGDVGQLIAENEKPKAGDFIAIFQAKTNQDATNA